MRTANFKDSARVRDAFTVRHWHISESLPGCVPESEPRISDSVDLAMDEFAHMVASYTELLDGQNDGQDGKRNGDARESSDAAYCRTTRRP